MLSQIAPWTCQSLVPCCSQGAIKEALAAGTKPFKGKHAMAGGSEDTPKASGHENDEMSQTHLLYNGLLYIHVTIGLTMVIGEEEA